MTAHELIAVIKGAGGVFTVSQDGQRVRCKVPRDAEWLADLARQHKEELRAALLPVGCATTPDHCHRVLDVQRFRSLVASWLAKHTVRSSRCASNPHILLREFSRFAGCEPTEYALRLLLTELEARGLSRDTSGMVSGIILADDYMAAWNLERHAKNQ